MAHGSEDKSLRILAVQRIESWRELERHEHGVARRYQTLHYGTGIPGTIVSAIGAVSFFADDFPVSASWVALIGGMLTALAAFLGSNRLAESRYRRHDCFEELVQRMENAVAGGREPTREELDRFAVDWRRCTHPQLQPDSPSAAPATDR